MGRWLLWLHARRLADYNMGVLVCCQTDEGLQGHVLRGTASNHTESRRRVAAAGLVGSNPCELDTPCDTGNTQNVTHRVTTKSRALLDRYKGR